MAHIIRYNNRAQITGLSEDHMTQLRKLVSYRAELLPPPELQALIKKHAVRSLGSEMGLRALLASPQLYAEIDAHGWAHRLTPRIYEAVLRLRHTSWDGWTTMIGSTGWFGPGLVPHVMRALTLHMGMMTPKVYDKRERPPSPRTNIGTMPDLYDFQREALDAWYANDGLGVIDLPPRSGKTRIMIAAVREMQLPTLVVVPKVGLVRQTVARFRAFFPDSHVIGVTGGKSGLTQKKQRAMASALVWVMTPQTAAGGASGGGVPGIKSRKVLVIDEFHHAAAKTWHLISRAAVNSYYRLGLTGTFFRSDGRDLAMHAVLADSVYSRTVREMIDLGRLVPARVVVVRLRSQLGETSGRLYNEGVTDHKERNAVIVSAIVALIRAGRRVLVLTKEVEHARSLAVDANFHANYAGSCEGRQYRVEQVDGSDNSRVRPILDALESGQVNCVIGTSVIGEGVDVPAADALVYAAAGRSKVKVVQDYFRALTESRGKAHGVIVDCADNHHPGLCENAAHRLALYREHFTADVVDAADLEAWVRRAV